MAHPASAQSWTGPDLSRRPFRFGHAAENFEFALTEICFPYLLQNAEANQWVRRQRRSGVAWFPPGGPFVGLTTYLVGGSAGAIAGVGDRIGDRECTVKGDSLDAEEYLAVLHTRLATLPYTFTQSTADIPPGEYATRQMFCSAADQEQFAVLISAGTRNGRRGQTVVTIVRMRERDARCDMVAPAPSYPAQN